MASVLPSIASLYRICIKSFSQLCDLLQVPGCEFSGEVSLLALENELGRFRIWAGNVGAHRNGRVSLDYKLREAPEVHEEVRELLKELEDALREAIAIVSHGRKPFDQLSWSPGSSVSSLETDISLEGEGSQEGESLTTELQERFLELAHVITCLYRFSIAIRNPVPRDRLEKCASIIISHYEPFDIQHTSHKFPHAAVHLIERLGKANSRRRQLFKYHGKHHDKLTRYIDLPEHGDATAVVNVKVDQNDVNNAKKNLQTVSEGDQGLGDRPHVRKGPGTIATTVNTQTTVSTYVQGLSDTIEVCSDAGQSQTSYATSASGDTGGKLRVPPPPIPDKTLDGKPFECPYCFSIVAVNSSKTWMRHVFRDLRPYVCTFKDCPKPDRLFDSRHDWYDHEVEAHRREWFCNACHQPFSSKNNFENHLRQNHLGLFTETQLPTIIDRCERAIENADQACPLCGDRFPPRGLKTHLARHMQQIALFTLPKTPEEANDRGSVGAQASEPDEEEEAEDGFPGSTGLDVSSVSSSKTILDSISSSQNEIPETENETWRLLTDPGYLSVELNSTVRANDNNERIYTTVEDLEAQTMGEMKTHPESSNTLTSMETLAAVYIEHGRYKEAEDLQVQVLRTRQMILGNEHPDTLEAMATLALLYFSQGRYGEGEGLQVQALAGMKKALGEEHPRTLSAMSTLESMCSNQERLKEAEILQVQALVGMEKTFGKEHPETLSVINPLSSTYSKQERLKEEEELRQGIRPIIREPMTAPAAQNTPLEAEFEYTALRLAVQSGNKMVVEKIIWGGAGARINTETAMFCAARQGHKDVVEYLLEKWIDMTVVDKSGCTALYLAAKHGHAEVVEIFLRNQAAVTRTQNYAPLQVAVQNGREQVIDILLGSEVRSIGISKPAALHCAAKQGDKDVVEVLVRKGVDVTYIGEDGNAALHLAASAGHEQVVEVLLKNGAKNEPNLYGYTPLLLAASKGHNKVAEVLLTSKADIEAKDNNGYSALNRAAEYGYYTIVEILLKVGANSEARERRNLFTALHLAAWAGYEKVVEVLLKNGADIEAQSKDTYTALHLAALNGHGGIVEVLLKNGANTEAQNKGAYTALHYAARYGHQKIVEVLLKSGANIEARGENTLTALHIVAWVGHEKVVEVLLKNGADIEAQSKDAYMALHLAAYYDCEKVVEVLLKNGANIEAQSKNSYTALHLGAQDGNEKVVEVLLKNGANIEAREEENASTALHLAAWAGYEKVVEVLLKNGANIEAREEESTSTALHLAAWAGYEKVVEVLLKNGASMNAINNLQETALQIAAKERHLQAMEVLQKYQA